MVRVARMTDVFASTVKMAVAIQSLISIKTSGAEISFSGFQWQPGAECSRRDCTGCENNKTGSLVNAGKHSKKYSNLII
jgi:hypothetical protein